MPAYQSLYRKHRPQRFSALVGQDHVTTALRNAVKDGRVGHAYLFSGPRGTGKTTMARILAKAVNCLALCADGEPCGVCESCVAIAEGRFLDLFERDAASNNKVDDMRDLIESVPMGLTAQARRKFYVLDEAHMLTGGAENALLKTLEEPPDHVVFVLATTEPEKVAPTIRSRTQHYEFTLFTTEELEALLADVVGREGVDAEPDAIAAIARAAAGSARDALSLLDQALAHGTGRLDAEPVTELFGRTPFEQRARVLEAVAGEDAAAVLVTLGELLDAGHEPRRIAEDLLRAARDGFLLNAGGGRVPVEEPDDQAKRLDELGRSLGNATLVRVLETLGQAIVDMRGTDAADPRLVLEIALVRLTRRDAGPALQTVIERIERLERELTERSERPSEPTAGPSTGPGTTIGALRQAQAAATETSEVAPVPPPEPIAPEATASRSEPPVVPDPAPPGPLQLDDVILAWGQVLPQLPVATRSAVQEAQPLSVADDVITFAIPPRLIDAARPRFKREADTIRDALSERLGRRLRFNVVADDVLEAAEGAPRSERPEGGSHAERAPAAGVSPAAASDAIEQDEIDAREGAAVDEPSDTVSMLTEGFGATVVEERPRE